ncbi:MAG TPA: FMN-dependent NADH-azoreductase [Methylophilaceae bacterium]|nr:FMN-dependent NADH-azoreductase [Methylophilaceae bacterium]
MNILQINSSARAGNSHSTRLANLLVDRLQTSHDNVKLVIRDLGKTPHPMLDEFALQAIFTPPEARTPEQQQRVALDDALIAEIQAADLVVLAVPMYNFSIPAQLKNWIDAISRAGVTFRYTAEGPEGLLKGKLAIVVQTRGGIHRNLPSDSLTPYLQTFLTFVGITDVRFVFAEGLSMGPEAEQQGMADAYAQIEQAVTI